MFDSKHSAGYRDLALKIQVGFEVRSSHLSDFTCNIWLTTCCYSDPRQTIVGCCQCKFATLTPCANLQKYHMSLAPRPPSSVFHVGSISADSSQQAPVESSWSQSGRLRNSGTFEGYCHCHQSYHDCRSRCCCCCFYFKSCIRRGALT